LANETSQSTSFDYCQFLRQGHLPLLAKLIQDSQKPSAELIVELKDILLPVGSSFFKLCDTVVDVESSESSETLTDSQSTTTKSNTNFINHHFLNEFLEKTSYGHPQCTTTPFSAWSCTFWQCRDMSLLGVELSRHFLINFVMRQAARMILEGALQSEEEVVEGKESSIVSMVVSDDATNDINATNASNATNTTAKTSRKRKSAPAPSTPSKTDSSITSSPTKLPAPASVPAPAPAPLQPQISSFFSKLERKRNDFATFTPGEYFQPFFVKPNTIVAPINGLLQSGESRRSADFSELRRRSSASPSLKKPRCWCVGVDGQATEAVIKLLRFEENYRPAYVGTWRKSPSSLAVSGRKPFGLDSAVDYEYESDEEWEDEDGEGEEGESLSSDDEEDEDDDDDDDGASVMSANESENVHMRHTRESYIHVLTHFVELACPSRLSVR
jgi:hypothetical protein